MIIVIYYSFKKQYSTLLREKSGTSATADAILNTSVVLPLKSRFFTICTRLLKESSSVDESANMDFSGTDRLGFW
jgi:hypothetical protein